MNTKLPAPLNVALYAPRIAQNAGQIARTCHAMNVALHLIRPLGFRVGSADLRRAGVGYWDELAPTIHENADAFRSAVPDADRVWLVTKHGRIDYREARYAAGDWLIFGNETEGLPREWLDARPARTIVIPMRNPGVRCLNLATAATVAIFEALRRIEWGPAKSKG